MWPSDDADTPPTARRLRPPMPGEGRLLAVTPDGQPVYEILGSRDGRNGTDFPYFAQREPTNGTTMARLDAEADWADARMAEIRAADARRVQQRSAEIRRQAAAVNARIATVRASTGTRAHAHPTVADTTQPEITDAQLRMAGAERYAIVDAAAVPSEPRLLATAAIVEAALELGFVRSPSRAIAWYRSPLAGDGQFRFVVGPAGVQGWTDMQAGRERTIFVRLGMALGETIETAVHEAVHSFQAEAMGPVQHAADKADREMRAERYAAHFRAGWDRRHPDVRS